MPADISVMKRTLFAAVSALPAAPALAASMVA